MIMNEQKLKKYYIHKGCGGDIVTMKCAWDDCFLGCNECYQHEFCDGFEMEEIK